MGMKINQLKDEWPDLTQAEWSYWLDHIDTQTTELLWCVEKQCYSLYTGTVAYFPDLSKAGLR